MIGIGGHLAVPPLPHHRAYGSRTRRFDWVKLEVDGGQSGACPLCHSRMLFVRAYPRETQEMLSDTGRASGQSRSTPEIRWHSASSFS